ncbi:MAG: LysM peptidoglycan-binding domain-containing protein [Lachnospiraceae bacterium]|jgi:peptidoglycan-binding lysin domain protein|nr:LysM peptidoglycan-binding domain-containing protein [Lachnospiraceae bacterium]MBS4936924.1 LysM peptidoglycan-binding domain-containing protein [Lachnospiraceae bacterium]DAQ79287.1 MAG TPA: tail assembly protein [Caudoviricetes sp.]
MEMWLKQDADLFRIPVLPSELKITSGKTTQTVNINAVGEILLQGKRTLKTLSFSSFFASTYDPSYCEYREDFEPVKAIEILENFKNKGTVNILITEVGINFDGIVTSLEYALEPNTKDYTYTISFTEDRKVNVPQQIAASSNNGAANTSNVSEVRTEKTATKGTTYVVKKGDCLSKIAKKLTGNEANWRKIYADNKKVIGSNPNKIYPGQKLIIG